MSNSVVLQCHGLSKRFDEADTAVSVLQGVDLKVESGERLAIIGQSGSGKSTLLHLLGGLETPSEGWVKLRGSDFSELSDAARGRLRNLNLGFIYQFHHLLPELSALENVAMPLLIRGDSVEEARQKSIKVLDKVGLAQRLNHRPAQLSGGERQRAAIARALVTRPACILADEPTGNLDRGNAEHVYELMLELNKDLGTSLILVTHDSRLAAKADRVLELVDGELTR